MSTTLDFQPWATALTLPAGAPAPAGAVRPPQILVVEDELIVALDVQRRLNAAGYAVVGIAANGTVAIELVQTLQPDLVLLDIGIQGELDGVDVAHRLADLADVPVIFVTGNSDEATLQRAEATHPYQYLLKPIRDRELKMAVGSALHHHRLARELRAARTSLEQRVAERTAELAALTGRLQTQIAQHYAVERELRVARLEIEMASRSKSRLFANLSREVRTPVEEIVRRAEQLGGSRLDSEQSQELRVIDRCGRSLAATIEEVTQYAELDSVETTLRSNPLDIRDLLQTVLTGLPPVADGAREILCDVAPEVPAVVQGDGDRLQQLLRPLLNLVRASSRGPVEVECTCVEQGPRQVQLGVSIRGEGPGLDTEAQKRIQAVFTQPDAALGELSGLGLGLAVPSLLVRRMDGILWLETIPGIGDTVHCRIWLGTAAAEESSPSRRR